MMKINNIQNYFEKNIRLKSLTELSYDLENGISLVSSNTTLIDYDSIIPKNDKIIKTADTLIFKKDQINFIEFKRGKISGLDFRLKATESLISFLNFSISSKILSKIEIPNKYFSMYVIYNKSSTATYKIELNRRQREMQEEYKHIFCKYKIIDNFQFIKIFKIGK